MRLEVVLSPLLYPCRTITANHATVAIDVLRATTALCAAFTAGCQSIVPLDTLDDISRYRQMGYKLAAERNGAKVGDAEYGNSPTEYLRTDMHGTKLAFSTTNGTRTLLLAAGSGTVMAGCFANLSALCQKLRDGRTDTVLLCSGWKGDFCIEDTLVAGAVIEQLADISSPFGDAAHMALSLWQMAKHDLHGFCASASHVQRLVSLGAQEDVDFALRTDTCPVVPTLTDGQLTI